MSDSTHKSESRVTKLKREKPWLFPSIALAFLLLVAAGFSYVYIAGKRVYIEKSSISATTISLSPSLPGTLEAVYVNEGDLVPENTVVARVGNEVIKTKTEGLVTSVHNNIGELVNPGTPVVTLIDPRELRVVGEVDEDKGLADIHVGEKAIFTVDTFGSEEYQGIVDEISPTSVASGVAFNISDKREVRQFDVKVRFDVATYKELKNGMSAKLWIYKDNQ